MAIAPVRIADEVAYAAERHLKQWLEADGPVTAYGSQWYLEAEVRFGRVEDIQSYVDKVLALLGYDRPVTVRKGRKNASMSRTGTMTIPDTAFGRREMTVLHELAHHLDRTSGHRDQHGPAFQELFVSLLEDTGHPMTARLLAIYFHEAS